MRLRKLTLFIHILVMKLSNIFLPTIVGIIVYSITNKLFPEKISNLNSKKDLRGGDRDLIRLRKLRRIVL